MQNWRAAGILAEHLSTANGRIATALFVTVDKED
jgi:hypothetical protein